MKDISPAAQIHAAGGVVYRTRKGSVQYLVAHRPRYNDWSIPKGKLDDGESFRDAAVREVEEETGYAVRSGAFLGGVLYASGNGNSKLVRYWLMKEKRGSFAPNEEVDEVLWLSRKKAMKQLSYARDRTLIDIAAGMIKHPKSATIYLVRHAHAGVRGMWHDLDPKRPISLRGYKQVSAIDNWLSNYPITTVMTSKFRRCRQTVGGYAKQAGLHLVRAPGLVDGSTAADVADVIAGLQGQQAVLCSHGEVIGDFIGKLVAQGVIDGVPEWRKGSVWTLRVRKGEVVAGIYRSPADL